MKKTTKTVVNVYKSAMVVRKDKMTSFNASRDCKVSKQVVDSLKVLDLRTPSDSAEIWKNKYFMEYRVSSMYRDAKYVLCHGTACLQQKDYHLARSCGASKKSQKGGSVVKLHLFDVE